MKRIIAAVALVLSMSLGGVAGNAETANARPDTVEVVDVAAHPGQGTIYDDLSAWACGASRPSSSYNVQNAVPFDIHSGAIWYSCTGHSHVTCRVATWVSTIIIDTGQVFGPVNGWNFASFC